MGKQKTGKQIKGAARSQSRISKQPNFTKSLQRQINRLRKHHSHMSTRQFSIRIHNFIKQFQMEHQIGRDLTAEAIDCMRICKSCDSWLRKDRFVECYQCEDSYHLGCALGDLSDLEEWLCPSCQMMSDMELTRQKILEKFGVSRKTTKFCNKCNQPAQDTKISCIRCKCHYHNECFQSGENVLVCANCHTQIEEELATKTAESTQTSLIHFDTDKKQQFFKNATVTQSEEDIEENSVTVSWAQPILLRPPIRLTQQQIQKYKKILLYALCSKQMEYTEQPVYKCPKPENIEEIDVTMDRINIKDLAAFQAYKKQPIGPYLIKAVEGMGYDVISEKPIPKGTIICEYVGQVITRREALSHIENDSLMELLLGKDADVSLIIKPQQYSNIARFINGINNANPESRKKININSVRLNVLGEPKVMLYARRAIKVGQSLLYDYNAALDKYPTDGFI